MHALVPNQLFLVTGGFTSCLLPTSAFVIFNAYNEVRLNCDEGYSLIKVPMVADYCDSYAYKAFKGALSALSYSVPGNLGILSLSLAYHIYKNYPHGRAIMAFIIAS